MSLMSAPNADAEDIVDFFMGMFTDYKDDDEQFKYVGRIQRAIAEGNPTVIVDFDDMVLYESQIGIEITDKLSENPYFVLEYAQAALEARFTQENPDFAKDIESAYVRFSNLPFNISLRSLRSKHVGFMKTVEGVVVKSTEVKAYIVEGYFSCKQNRDHIVIMPLMDGTYTTPTKCSVPTCQSKDFSLETEFSRKLDWQMLTIQEMPETVEAGRTPRSIKCRLVGLMVDTVRPGNRVAATGIIRTKPTKSLKKGSLVLLDKWMDSNYIKILGYKQESDELSEEDIEEFQDWAQDPELYNKLVASFAPQIYGMNEVKEALLLFLFGGVDKIGPDIKIRGQPNILLVGDPGMGKSVLLKYTKDLSPRGVFTSGKGASAAGLTASVIRDPDTGEFNLEAGAIVLADEGACFIDEFDKMSENDRSAIHEAMEQHQISISKAGIVTTLNARTGIAAAANPKWGRYESNRTFTENVNLPEPILSRFDLIFTLRDDPKNRDETERVEYIIAQHQILQGGIKQPPLASDRVRKYISYAKNICNPALSNEAGQVIQGFYVGLRANAALADDKKRIPITDRQLESIIRIAEARAKVNLRNTVTKVDAQKAIDLVSYCLYQIGIDPETGELDVDSIYSGQTSTKRAARNNQDKLMALIALFNKDSVGRPFSEEAFKEEAKNEGLSEEYVNSAIAQLLRDGILYTPKPGTLKVA